MASEEDIGCCAANGGCSGGCPPKGGCIGGCAANGGCAVKSCRPRPGRVGRKFGAPTTTIAGYGHQPLQLIHPGLHPVYAGAVVSTVYCSGCGAALTKYCTTGGAGSGRKSGGGTCRLAIWTSPSSCRM